MKKVASLFIVAVFVPSLALAWLAVRSLRDQQLILERQQSLLYQGVADSLAKEADDFLTEQQHEFGRQVEAMLADRKAHDLPITFDDRLRTNWFPAQVGFVVTVKGDILSCVPNCTPAAQAFYTDNGKFLGNRESAEVYWNSTKNTANNSIPNNSIAVNSSFSNGYNEPPLTKSYFAGKQKMRNVVPQQQPVLSQQINEPQNYSKVESSEAEFRQLVGDSNEGMVARFLENKLNLLLWYRSPRDTNLI